jgi:hypothetical protein
VKIRANDIELDISGSPSEMNAIADRIEQLSIGEELLAATDIADARPYDRCLVGLTACIGEGPVRVSVDGDRVIITASPLMMRKFASFFRFDPNARRGMHHHHEWFKGNEYVTPDSIPLVVGIL